MHPAVENFLERPTSHKAGFWVVSLGFVCFVMWTYVYGPAALEVEELKEKVDGLQSQIAQESRIARNKDKFLREVKDLDIQLADALRRLPDKREIPDLLNSISNLARDAGLEVALFKPRAENYKDFFAEVPVDISVEGSFHRVATFFDEVGKLPRIVNISGITMRDPKVFDETVTIKTDCVATTFRYLDEAERKAAQEKSGGSKRRNKK